MFQKLREHLVLLCQSYMKVVAARRYLSGLREVRTGSRRGPEVIDIDPDFGITYFTLAWRNQDLNRPEVAGKALRAGEGKLNAPHLLLGRYNLAFVRGNQAEMDQVVAISRENAAADEWVSDPRSFVLAYSGHLQEARKLKQHAADLAQQSGHGETAALYKAGEAVREAFLGNAVSQSNPPKQHLRCRKTVEWSTAPRLRLLCLATLRARKT
jgi:hypothetical protein